MRYLVLLLVFACTCLNAASQGRKSRFDLEFFDALKFKPFTVEIATKGKSSVETHFNSLVIQDFRADKSKLGFARAGEKNENRRFVFPDDDEAYLTKKINKLFSCNSNSRDTIVLALKNFWLFQTQQQADAVKKLVITEIQLISHCFINCDVYALKKGIATNLGTIDTVISMNGWIVNRSNDLLKKVLLSSLYMCDSLFQLQPAIATNRDVIKPALNFPIISVVHSTRGIYFTYQDFLNNSPDTASFETEIKAKRRILKSAVYPDSIIQRCWGYSDDGVAYMNINNDFYRLNRSQNTFDVRGPFLVDMKNSTTSKILRTGVDYFLISRPLVDLSEFAKPSSETLEFFKYYQLDIYTGTLR